MAEAAQELLALSRRSRADGRPAEAARLCARAVAIARAAGAQRSLAQALIGLGQADHDLGNLDAARQSYEEAVSVVRSLDDARWLAHTVRHVGDIISEQSRFSEGAPCYEEALAIYSGSENTAPLEWANALRGYALLKERTGELATAAALWREARDLYAAVDVRAGVVESDKRLAILEKRG